MALTTYAELKTSIANNMHRSDLTAVIPDFVTLAEKRIVNDIITSGGHTAIEDVTSLPTSSYEATLPTEFAGVRSIVTEESTPQQIKLVTLDILKTSYAVAGTGRAGTIQGNKLILSPDAGTYNVTMYYYKNPTAMSADSDTNELYPLLSNVYLYGSLIEASLYIQDDPSRWVTAYADAITKSVKSNKQSRWANAMTVRAA